MAEKPENILRAKFHHVWERDLTQEELADLFETVAPEIAGQIGARRQHGQVEMARGGYCEWRLEYICDVPQR